MQTKFASYLAFAAFGLFWGTWGAMLPALRQTSDLTDGQLGGALLLIGAGALPAMAFTGRAVDRFGVRITGVLVISLGIAGVAIAAFARDAASLSIGMLLVGATSGASDVSANALAGLAEKRSGHRVITLAHAVFSSFVVVGSMGAGGLLALTDAILPVFLTAGILIAAAGAMVFRVRDGDAEALAPTPRAAPPRVGTMLLPFVAVGLVGALGFAMENAHQSWSAIFLGDELGTTPLVAALAPATFAAFAAVTRFAVGASRRIPDLVLLTVGPVLAGVGTLILAGSHALPWAIVGLALAAIGTSVLFPTLLSRATRDVADAVRGRATSLIGTTAYLGFLLGPVYVGVLSDAFGLRSAMVGVAVLAAAFALVAPVAGGARRRRATAPTHLGRAE